MKKRPAAQEMLDVPPAVETYKNLDEVRKGLRLLDESIPHSLLNSVTGEWKSIPGQTLRDYYMNRRLHMLGYNSSVRTHQDTDCIYYKQSWVCTQPITREVGVYIYSLLQTERWAI